ncbi:MAG TPA: STAS domain-containing protein [Solirubrobacteraceae bacterium]|jgi:anti-anti-sigma factor|nr:STAS domain-containing protein [Solirubrobacteraceae bacterium]
MVLQVEHFDTIPVARAPVDIDAANAAKVRDELTACMRRESFELVVDLTDTRYLDSAGIDMLFRLNERLAHRRATLRLVIAPGSDLARLAELVSFTSAISVHADVRQAVEAAARRGAAESAPDH